MDHITSALLASRLCVIEVICLCVLIISRSTRVPRSVFDMGGSSSRIMHKKFVVIIPYLPDASKEASAT
eukprot:scaffold610_cov352-Pavlova_lutheri.AAC.1